MRRTKKKRKLFKEQGLIYLKLIEIQEGDIESNILLTVPCEQWFFPGRTLEKPLLAATMKMKCCYSNEIVKD